MTLLSHSRSILLDSSGNFDFFGLGLYIKPMISLLNVWFNMVYLAAFKKQCPIVVPGHISVSVCVASWSSRYILFLNHPDCFSSVARWGNIRVEFHINYSFNVDLPLGEKSKEYNTNRSSWTCCLSSSFISLLLWFILCLFEGIWNVSHGNVQFTNVSLLIN